MHTKLRPAIGAALVGLLLAGCSGEQVVEPRSGAALRPGSSTMDARGQGAGSGVGDTGPGEVWLLSQGTDRLFIVDRHGKSVESVALPAGAGPHITTFTSDGETAFISAMGNGSLYVVDADEREIVQTIALGSAGTHQAKPGPDDSVLLVAQIASRRLVKLVLAADGTWSPAGALTFPAEVGRPICSIFRPDGLRAYASLLPSGLAVVDVPTMALVEVIPTDGFLACGMVPTLHGREAILASRGSGGHIYRLSTETDELESLGTIGAPDWHSFILHAGGHRGFGTVPHGDALALVNLDSDGASPAGFLSLDATPGPENDQPDRMSIHGNTLYAVLRASGKLAIVELPHLEVRYLDLSPPAPFDPATCAGCALHGVNVRPGG